MNDAPAAGAPDDASSAAKSELEAARRLIGQTNKLLEEARDAVTQATQARARAGAEADQVGKILASLEAARSAAEQESAKVVAASATATATVATIEASHAKAVAAASAIVVQQNEALAGLTAVGSAKATAEQGGAGAQAARLAAEAERDKTSDYAKATNEAKQAVDALLTAIGTMKNQAEAARDAAVSAQGAAITAMQGADVSAMAAGRMNEQANLDLTAIQDRSTTATATAAALTKLQERMGELVRTAETDAASAAQFKVKAESEAGRAANAHNLSTTVGLAGAFNKKADKSLQREVFWGLALLVSLGGIVVLGLARYQAISAKITSGATLTVISMEVLLAIFGVSGFVWLGWIATRMIQKNFAVTEDYAYKAALATAYVGFRTEAKGLNDTLFEQRLFAAAISQLDASPVRLLDSSHPGSPLQDLLNQPFFRDFIEQTPDAKRSLIAWFASRFQGAKRGPETLKSSN